MKRRREHPVVSVNPLPYATIASPFIPSVSAFARASRLRSIAAMKSHRVTCITKLTNGSHRHITHLGGGGPSAWRFTTESIVRRIDSGEEEFFVEEPITAKRAYVGVVRSLGRAPYLQTWADGLWNDRLLLLPACPPSHRVTG